MATITFKYQDRTTVVYQNDAFVEAYSDYPDELTKIIREITDIECALSYDRCSWDDKQHLKSKVTVGLRGKKMQFDFHHSLKDTEEWRSAGLDSNFLKDILYDLLCTIRCESGVHELDFDEFCVEYGYDKDSGKAYTAYRQCCNFSRKIALVFSAEELATFPS